MVTDIGSGCTTKDTAIVTILDLPTKTAGINTTICGSATSFQLGSTPMTGVTYQWASNPAGAVFSSSNTEVQMATQAIEQAA